MNAKILLLIYFLILPQGLWAAAEVSVLEYGAKGDGKTLNTIPIQKAIDDLAQQGGGKVIIPAGEYVSGTLLLRDNIHLFLAEGAQLLGSPDPRDYQSIDAFVDATGQLRGKCLIGAKGVKNIAITGQGTIDGRGENFLADQLKPWLQDAGLSDKEVQDLMGDRPFLLRFVESKNILLQGINMRQPAAWTCHFFQSSHIRVEGVSIYSHAHRNNDGIDLDSSHHVRIENSNIDTGDDAICVKSTSPEATHHVKVRNCRLKSDWGAIKFGTESMGDFHHISVKNCSIHDTKGGGIKILSVDGANIHHISIKKVQMENTEMPIFIRLGERQRTYRDAPAQPVGTIRKLLIKQVEASLRPIDSLRVSPPTAIFITGTEDHNIDAVKLKKITVRLPGGGKYHQREIDIPRMPERYPEFSFFGVLPAYGLVARNVDKLVAKGIEFILEDQDFREAIWLQEVDKSTINQKNHD
ncbi:exo-poly-alpha-D-galacturonosidase [Echinicola pacifica]|uniref:Exo-poly-alpha-D-galacturonosidase n=1 Tax=Echinicola pacifica TaxID=346377 RepID=A0A918PVD5_9BACT|nr:glycoside hydrolase family 28 protein [Echinicola pacifica]GGZ24618.1 exo-poly-alpha-D-galacturonosidase [Echinicola pacifica]